MLKIKGGKLLLDPKITIINFGKIIWSTPSAPLLIRICHRVMRVYNHTFGKDDMLATAWKEYIIIYITRAVIC